MDRRTFLRGATLVAVAPMVIKASHLMRVWVPPEPEIFTGYSARFSYDFVVTMSDGPAHQSKWLASQANYGDIVLDADTGQRHMLVQDGWRTLHV